MLNLDKNLFRGCSSAPEFSDKLYKIIQKNIGVDGPYLISSKAPVEKILAEIVGKDDAAYWKDPRFYFEKRDGGNDIKAKSIVH